MAVPGTESLHLTVAVDLLYLADVKIAIPRLYILFQIALNGDSALDRNLDLTFRQYLPLDPESLNLIRIPSGFLAQTTTTGLGEVNLDAWGNVIFSS